MNQLWANKCLTDRIKIEFSPVSGQILFSLVLISAVSGCSEASGNQDSVANAETLSPLAQLTADAISLGDAPALTPNEIDDVAAFLQTLTNGFQP
jgi:hypothetical protein